RTPARNAQSASYALAATVHVHRARHPHASKPAARPPNAHPPNIPTPKCRKSDHKRDNAHARPRSAHPTTAPDSTGHPKDDTQTPRRVASSRPNRKSSTEPTAANAMTASIASATSDPNTDDL